MKNYLRSTMGANRLQNLMLLNRNKDFSDSINIDCLVKKWTLIKEKNNTSLNITIFVYYKQYKCFKLCMTLLLIY